MDALINSLQNFALSKDESIFEDSLNDLMDKMSNSKLEDPDREWKDLTGNYSKLKYLKELIHSFNILPNFFLNPFMIFMESIDKMSQYYLKEIDWYHSDHDIHDDCLEVQSYLEESLNINDPIEKLNIILKAYSIIILIGEETRRETYNYHLNDTEFLKTFKKRRVN